jgi:hypothetical protein
MVLSEIKSLGWNFLKMDDNNLATCSYSPDIQNKLSRFTHEEHVSEKTKQNNTRKSSKEPG